MGRKKLGSHSPKWFGLFLTVMPTITLLIRNELKLRINSPKNENSVTISSHIVRVMADSLLWNIKMHFLKHVDNQTFENYTQYLLLCSTEVSQSYRFVTT